VTRTRRANGGFFIALKPFAGHICYELAAEKLVPIKQKGIP
jgi:hypothetical protein